MENRSINVIGAGLAGSEAAWQLAQAGLNVKLYEMKPVKFSPAHKSEGFAELVCSNSFRADHLSSGVGLLKEEMRMLDSLIITTADELRLPAGQALAVDRDIFSQKITEKLQNHPLIEIVHEVIETIPNGPTIIATGPLTDDTLSAAIAESIGSDYLFFFDAAAPIIERDSIDFSKAYYKSRYDKGTADYINCPMNAEEYQVFYDALTNAEQAPLNKFEEDRKFFEGCMPVEEMARRGEKTLLFGPLKPVGLEHPETGERAKAVVQLRQDNAANTLYNVVGFQTNLKWGEQKRVLSLIPGLENCEIVRYGVMHRNTFINSPVVIDRNYRTKMRDDLYFAGQISGVEGYVESAASGLVSALDIIARVKHGIETYTLPLDTMIGAQANYISTTSEKDFQPMNANFGLLPSLDFKVKKRDRKLEYSKRSIESLKEFLA